MRYTKDQGGIIQYYQRREKQLVCLVRELSNENYILREKIIKLQQDRVFKTPKSTVINHQYPNQIIYRSVSPSNTQINRNIETKTSCRNNENQDLNRTNTKQLFLPTNTLYFQNKFSKQIQTRCLEPFTNHQYYKSHLNPKENAGNILYQDHPLNNDINRRNGKIYTEFQYLDKFYENRNKTNLKKLDEEIDHSQLKNVQSTNEEVPQFYKNIKNNQLNQHTNFNRNQKAVEVVQSSAQNNQNLNQNEIKVFKQKYKEKLNIADKKKSGLLMGKQKKGKITNKAYT